MFLIVKLRLAPAAQQDGAEALAATIADIGAHRLLHDDLGGEAGAGEIDVERVLIRITARHSQDGAAAAHRPCGTKVTSNVVLSPGFSAVTLSVPSVKSAVWVPALLKARPVSAAVPVFRTVKGCVTPGADIRSTS
jgi:hypothetical protein